MTLCSSREVKRALELYVIPELNNCKDYYQIKDFVKNQSKEILIPEGSPESRTQDIKKLIKNIEEKIPTPTFQNRKLFATLKQEANHCLTLPVDYSNRNLSSAEASNNRCYAYEFKELLSVINKKPQKVFEDA